MIQNLVLLALALNAHAAPPSAESLLQSSDRARGAAASLQGVSWVARITTHENDTDSEATYDIKVRGNDALAEVKAPARQKGELILFNDRVLWFYKPGLKKPVSISARQKLMGQAANGDIASTNYARDYEGTFQGEETINGVKCFKLHLKARAHNVTYDQIRYWISEEKKIGVRAEFLTLSGEVFKSADFTYGNTVQIKGENYPFVSEMIIRDAHQAKNITTIHYQTPREANHPVSIFNVNNLLR